MSTEKNCSNCGYVEKTGRKKSSPMFCSNLDSEHCAEWVTSEDICPCWVELNHISKFYNVNIL